MIRPDLVVLENGYNDVVGGWTRGTKVGTEGYQVRVGASVLLGKFLYSV